MKKIISMALAVALMLGVISATLMTADAAGLVDFDWGFQSVTPTVSQSQLESGSKDLGQVAYNTPTMFGFVAKQLPQSAVEAGYSIKEIIYVSHKGGASCGLRNTGAQFDVMEYISEPGTYQVWFYVNLYKDGNFVLGDGMTYQLKVVPAIIDEIAITVAPPVVGAVPQQTVAIAQSGCEVVELNWSCYNKEDGEYYLMTEGMTFVKGETYECKVEIQSQSGYAFPQNSAIFAATVNGKAGSVWDGYQTDRLYVRVIFTPQPAYGDVDCDGQVKATDALLVLQAVVGKFQPDAPQTTAADVDGDGQVKATDALLILQHIVGKCSTFPATQK